MANENNSFGDFMEQLKTAPASQNLMDMIQGDAKPEDGETGDERGDKKLPYDKDPKLQRYIEKRIKQSLSEMPQETQTYVKENPSELKDLISAFEKIAGTDDPDKKALVEHFGKTMADFQERVERAESIAREQEQETQAEARTTDELNDGFESIEDEFGINLWNDKKSRLRFLEFVEDISHKDADGEPDQLPDLVGAYRIFSKGNRQSSQSQVSKDLADRSGNRSGGGVNSPAQNERITFDNIGDRISRMFG